MIWWPLDPQTYQYTTRDGRSFVLNTTTGVQSTTDTNGNTVTFGAAGIVHSCGKSVIFKRDAQNRITQITAPGPAVHLYEYDVNGDLASYIDPAVNVSRSFYNFSHGVIEIRDPRGVRPIHNEYDQSGRLVAPIDAHGHRVEYQHDVSARRELKPTVGRVRLLEYVRRGQRDARNPPRRHLHDQNLRRTQQPADRDRSVRRSRHSHLQRQRRRAHSSRSSSGTSSRRSLYNARGQVLTRTDGRGNVTTHTYDANDNLLSTTDGEGNRTSYTYDAAGSILTLTDPRGGVTTNVYDAPGNLIRITDPLGTVITYVYDAAGRRLSEAKSRTVGGVAETLTTTFTYDALGQPVRTTRPDWSTLLSEYDSVGNLTAAIDPLGRRTCGTETTRSIAACARAFPTGRANACRTTPRGSSSREDRPRRSLTTSISYDLSGRVRRITSPDGAFVELQTTRRDA